MEPATLYQQLKSLESLISEVKVLASSLRYHLITRPDQLLNDLMYYGLAPDIVQYYRARFYEQDKSEAERILAYIDGKYLVYLEDTHKKLLGALDQLN